MNIIARDAAIRKDELAKMKAGLEGDALDHFFWLDKARARVSALAEDEDTFGLVPHEVQELRDLRALVSKYEATA